MTSKAVDMVLHAGLCITALLGLRSVVHAQTPQSPIAVSYFDVLDLPARIDEPKLHKVRDGYLLKCAVANRSSEKLLGLRLIIIVVEREGKLRTHTTWNEAAVLAAYSIQTFEFRPQVKSKIQDSDRLFLAIDEVIDRETIWHVVDGYKALRAYSRGQHDVMPKIRTMINQIDPRWPARVIREENQ